MTQLTNTCKAMHVFSCTETNVGKCTMSVHVLQIHVLLIHVLLIQSSPCFTTCPKQLQFQIYFFLFLEIAPLFCDIRKQLSLRPKHARESRVGLSNIIYLNLVVTHVNLKENSEFFRCLERTMACKYLLRLRSQC